MNNVASSPAEHLQFGKNILEKFLQIKYIKNNASINREANHALNRLNDNSFKIAVIGEFSSGKSTFLNAIIGRDYLTHGVRQTTATVTMLVNVSADKHGFGRIVFKDGTIKTLDAYEQLKEVTTTHSSAYQVSRQIDSVELFVPFMDTEVPVVLVDTPGLNGVAAMNKERTIDIIKSVHACIYMLQSRGISETDKKTLQWVGQYQSELIIVQNFIDDINKSEGDTLEDVLDKQQKILSESVFSEQERVNYTVCGVSAMKALASKDKSIKRLYSIDTFELTDAVRQRLYHESNFEQAMNCINQFMQQALQRSHISTLCSTYNLLERTANIMNSQYDIVNALWENSDNAQIVLRTTQLLENWESRQAENEEKLDNFIISKMSECRRLAINELRRLIEEAESKIPDIYREITEPEEWDTFIKNKVMETAIDDLTSEIKHFLEEFLLKSCENTHNLAILRIQEYSGLTDVFSNQSLPGFQTKISEHSIKRFTQEESDIEKEEAELLRLKSQINVSERQKSRLHDEERRLENSINKGRQKRNLIESDYESRKRGLGQKPEVTTYYENVTKRKQRGGFFGSIADFFDGGKKVTRREPRYDYSAQRQWEENERLLKNDYNKKKTELNSQLRFLEQEMGDTKQQIAELNKTTKTDSTRIERKQAVITEKIESLKEKRLLAAKEYLQRQKDKLRLGVSDYLSNSLHQLLSENVNHEVNRAKEKMCSGIRKLYADVSRNQKEDLQKMLNNKRGDDGFQHENLKQDIDSVLTIKNELEEYLCG